MCATRAQGRGTGPSLAASQRRREVRVGSDAAPGRSFVPVKRCVVMPVRRGVLRTAWVEDLGCTRLSTGHTVDGDWGCPRIVSGD